VAESIPWDDGTFDSVVMADVLEHCANDRDSLQEVFRILKENGRAVITVPAYAWLWSGHDTANHHYRRYSKQELQQKLLASGFVIEKITYYNTFLFPFVVLTRGLKKVLRRTGSDLTMPPAIINKFLAAVFDSEKVILSRGGVFPFGVSLLCVVRRPMTNKV
ncbi:MAG TPA: methyltransferase domain-containing protein, partial [Patescibacteria group bacterium]